MGRPKGLRVRTACTTAEEFIALYKMKCDEVSIFAVTQKMLPQGAACAFSLELADGSPMVRGLGFVLDSFASADNRFGDVGVHIQFDQLTTTSDPIVDRLLEARALVESRQRQRRSPITQRRFAVEPTDSETTNEVEPDEESVIRDVRVSITREMQAADEPTSTGAPLPIDERSSNTSRYEGLLRGPAMPAKRPPTPRPPSTPMPRQPTPPPVPIVQTPTQKILSLATAPDPGTSPGTSPGTEPGSPMAIAYAAHAAQAYAGTARSPDITPLPPIPRLPPPPNTPAPVLARGSSEVVPAEAPAATPADPELSPTDLGASPIVPIVDDTGLIPALWASLTARIAAAAERYPRVADRLRTIWSGGTAKAVVAKDWTGKRLAPVGAALSRARLKLFGAPRATTSWWRNGRVIAVFAAGLLFGLWMKGGSDSPTPVTIAATTPAECSVEPVMATAPALDPAEAQAAIAKTPTKSSTRAKAKPAAAATSVAAAEPPVGTKVAKPKPKPAPAIAKPAVKPAGTMTAAKPTAATKPAAIAKPATAPLTKPAPTARPTTAATPAAKPATTVAKPATATVAKPAPTTVAKPAATTVAKPAATTVAKPAATTRAKPAPTTKPATAQPTKPGTVATNAKTAAKPAPKKGGCQTLDCI